MRELLSFPLAASGGQMEGLIWVVIVVGSILAQIIKSSRKASKKPPPRAAENGRARRPEEQLRAFLEGLGAPAPRPHPTPAAGPPPPPPPATRSSRSTRAARPRTQAAPPRPPAAVRMTIAQDAPSNAYDLRVKPEHRPSGHQLRRTLGAELRRPSSIRKAVLLREILGPPPGLSSTTRRR